MIYQNEDGMNIIEFGTGDIEISSGSPTEGPGVCITFTEQKPAPIGELSEQSLEKHGPGPVVRTDPHTMFVFISPQSIDVVIDKLQGLYKPLRKKVYGRRSHHNECPKCGGGPVYQDRLDAELREAHCDDCGETVPYIESQILSDLLSLVCVEIDPKTIDKWTYQQRGQASNWAANVHLAASDNDVDVPEKPNFLESS